MPERTSVCRNTSNRKLLKFEDSFHFYQKYWSFVFRNIWNPIPNINNLHIFIRFQLGRKEEKMDDAFAKNIQILNPEHFGTDTENCPN